MINPDDLVPGVFRRADGSVDREALAERVRREIVWTGTDWSRMNRVIESFEAELNAVDSREGYRRNWTVTHPLYVPAIDVCVALVRPNEADDMLQAGATLYASGIATSETPDSDRLSAETPLELTSGTNAGCCDGWETSIFTVREGPHIGVRIGFIDELRWGLGPALARAALRRSTPT